MNKSYTIIVILAIMFILSGCNSQSDVKENTIDKVSADNTQDIISPENSQESNNISNIVSTQEGSVQNQPVKKTPVVKQGDNLPLPSGFPGKLIPIMDDANITNTTDDGESYSIVFKTKKKFNEVVSIYKDFMKNAKIIMEDTQGNSYYTINGSKDKNNIFIAVMAYSDNTTDYHAMVSINTNQFDLSAVDEGKKLREQLSDVPNKPDYTSIVLGDPESYLPPPKGLDVERKSVKTLVDKMVIDIYPNESAADFGKISGDVIFKQKVVPSDATSLYQDGDTLPAIFQMIESDNINIKLIIKGVVQFRGKKYSLAEYNYTADPEVLNDGHEYVPNSEKIKFHVYIPHTGDEYWFVAWNSREVYSINYPKYLIQAEGLDKMLDKN